MARAAFAASEGRRPSGVVIEIDGIEKLDLSDSPEDPILDTPETEPATTDPPDDSTPTIKDAAVELTSTQLSKLMETAGLAKEAGNVVGLSGALSAISMALDPEAVAAEIAEDRAAEAVSAALADLMDTAALIKSLDDGIEALPEAITKQLSGIAGSLAGASSANKSADPTVGDLPAADLEFVTDPDPEAGPLTVYKRQGGDGDLDLVIKRGAKMKTTRLSKLKEAHAMLSKLIEELEGDANSAKDGGAKEPTKKADESAAAEPADTPEPQQDPAEGSPAGDDVTSQIAEAVKKGLLGAVGAINESLNKLNSKIEDVAKRVDNVEGTVPAGQAADDGDAEPTKKNDPASFANIFGISG